jgi:hypothetical protein
MSLDFEQLILRNWTISPGIRACTRNDEQLTSASIDDGTLLIVQLFAVIDERSRTRLIRFDYEISSHIRTSSLCTP